MLNISKKRKFPEDIYEIYRIPKKELGNILNTWFPGINFSRNQYWTVKECDKQTTDNLYRKKYNPISFSIYKNFTGKHSGWSMCARIHSIDDSSYGIWFDNAMFGDLIRIRLELMRWISDTKIINGEAFLELCIEYGADPETKDYN